MPEEEADERLHMAYCFILQLAAKAKAGRETVGSQTPPATEPQGDEPQDNFILYDVIEKVKAGTTEAPDFEAS